MGKFKVGQFIAMDKGEYNAIIVGGSLRDGYQFTETGMVIIDIGTLVPCIVKGHNCIGYAKINSLYITAESTTISFTIITMSKQDAEAHFNMYRQVMSTTIRSSDDRYEDSSDMSVGLYRGKSSANIGFNNDDDDDDYETPKRGTESIVNDILNNASGRDNHKRRR